VAGGGDAGWEEALRKGRTGLEDASEEASVLSTWKIDRRAVMMMIWTAGSRLNAQEGKVRRYHLQRRRRRQRKKSRLPFDLVPFRDFADFAVLGEKGLRG